MADDIDSMLDAAELRGRRSLAAEPRAASARYDAATGRVVVDLTNGCAFLFPARAAEGLETASEDDLAVVEVGGAGYGLHWPRLDVDLSVPGLLAGLFGTRAFMDRQRAARAGSTRSPAKAAAARRNGAKGGRPKGSATPRLAPGGASD
ncbi:MAG: hypothetical protein RLY86_438 [Pseudomonadota bacterium]|jgi:hypothetical protein